MQQKQLFRSYHNRMISGVCGGIAEYFNIDVSIIRIIAVILAFSSFSCFIIPYIVCAVVIPNNPYQHSQTQYTTPPHYYQQNSYNNYNSPQQ